CMQPLEFPHSF
nr:immunoglobulin light chain junction region [Macaca mulatta]MOX98317.1 immunoglobulin light chain junction region [Macaca mulatta]MOX98527.1 immunoglobulin light chain junction region [Macaca mulatta]MOX99530.1 immunoglobulin light chain junction region [Macaca mulatta]MOY00242.1 immunoglobulin light chain junction region [Macaca mulatta]